MKQDTNSTSGYSDEEYLLCYKRALSGSLFVWGCLLIVALVCLVAIVVC